jgi:tetratricopeptide (TPR) repeat protein
MISVERFHPIAPLALLIAALLLTRAADAQDAATVAEALFREGTDLLRRGELEAACSKLAESGRLDPSAGTLLNLADCHERQGKTASAWAEFHAAARIAARQGRQDAADEAKRRAAAIEPKLSYLRIELSRKIPNTSLRLDAMTLEANALGSRLPVDPGGHVIVISAPGYEALTLPVQIGPGGDAQTLTIPMLRPLAAPPARRTGADKRAAQPSAPREEPAKRTPPTLAYAIGGAGVAALGVGAAFAFLARSAYEDAESECPTRSGCSERALSLREQAETRANISNAGIGLGLVGVGVGAVLVLTSSASDDSPSPSAARSGVLGLAPEVSLDHIGIALQGVGF